MDDLNSDVESPASGILVDPILSHDSRIVDLNFSYHSVDEKNKISTQVILKDNEDCLVGSWTNLDGSHTVLFVTPRIHYINDLFTRIIDSDG